MPHLMPQLVIGEELVSPLFERTSRRGGIGCYLLLFYAIDEIKLKNSSSSNTLTSPL